MRKRFIEDMEVYSKPGNTDHRAVRPRLDRLVPWAEKIIKVWGGWMAFESDPDFKTWRSQK